MHNWIVAAVAAATLAGTAAAQDMMSFADPNGDGKVTAEEYADFAAQGWDYFSQGASKVKVADLDAMAKGAFVGIAPDAEGFVTKDTYTAATPGRFKGADKNGDGALSSDELKGMMTPPAN